MQANRPRRRFLKDIAFTAAAFSTPGLLAEELTKTAKQAEGPFYPDKLPLEESRSLLKEAGLKGKIARNYVCNGTQLHFVQPGTGKPVILGNSTLEPFAGQPDPYAPPKEWKSWTASCHCVSHTCIL